MELLTAEWTEIVTAARTALEAESGERLEAVDAAIRYRFHELARGGDGEKASEFLGQLLQVTDSNPARKAARVGVAARYAVEWRGMAKLVEGLRRGEDPVVRAERFLKREGARAVLEAVSAAGPAGIGFGELAGCVTGMAASNVARMATEMVRLHLIERHRAGRNTFYTLGLAGQVLREREAGPRVAVLAVPANFHPMKRPVAAMAAGAA